MQGTNRQGTEVKMHKMGYCFFEGRGRTNSNERIECEYFFFFFIITTCRYHHHRRVGHRRRRPNAHSDYNTRIHRYHRSDSRLNATRSGHANHRHSRTFGTRHKNYHHIVVPEYSC